MGRGYIHKQPDAYKSSETASSDQPAGQTEKKYGHGNIHRGQTPTPEQLEWLKLQPYGGGSASVLSDLETPDKN
jgi:hypothetical protein